MYDYVRAFFYLQNELKEKQKQFDETKKEFYEKMEKFFEENDVEKSTVFTSKSLKDEDDLTVTRTQKSSITFYPEKVKKALGKELSKQVIESRYEIIDFDGLVSYLKECGVDPKIFKTFLNVEKKVNEKELDKLDELGKIDIKQLKGCYTVKNQKPYFTVKRGKNNGEQKW